jgi:hypothetical protein
MNNNPIITTLMADPAQALKARRYETGRVIAVSGGIAEIDVGAKLPDGSTQSLFLPVAAGLSIEPGQSIGIIYPNDNPNAAYVVAVDDLAQTDPTLVRDLSIALQSNTSTTAYESNGVFERNLIFCPLYANTGAVTLNMNGLGAKKLCDSTGTQISTAGVLQARNLYLLEFDQTLDSDNGGWKVANLSAPMGTLASPGYQTFPGGLTMQWGTVASGSGDVTVTFPIAFTNVYVVLTGVFQNTGTDWGHTAQLYNKTATGFTAKKATANTIDWWAIGYIAPS